jgi:hypothetical protein
MTWPDAKSNVKPTGSSHVQTNFSKKSKLLIGTELIHQTLKTSKYPRERHHDAPSSLEVCISLGAFSSIPVVVAYGPGLRAGTLRLRTRDNLREQLVEHSVVERAALAIAEAVEFVEVLAHCDAIFAAVHDLVARCRGFIRDNASGPVTLKIADQIEDKAGHGERRLLRCRCLRAVMWVLSTWKL